MRYQHYNIADGVPHHQNRPLLFFLKQQFFSQDGAGPVFKERSIGPLLHHSVVRIIEPPLVRQSHLLQVRSWKIDQPNLYGERIAGGAKHGTARITSRPTLAPLLSILRENPLLNNGLQSNHGS